MDDSRKARAGSIVTDRRVPRGNGPSEFTFFSGHTVVI